MESSVSVVSRVVVQSPVRGPYLLLFLSFTFVLCTDKTARINVLFAVYLYSFPNLISTEYELVLNTSVTIWSTSHRPVRRSIWKIAKLKTD